MATQSETKRPAWTLGDRLAKARRSAGITTRDMAARLRVARQTVSNYEHDITRVPHAVVMVDADLTGVDETWLSEGDTLPFEGALPRQNPLRPATRPVLGYAPKLAA